MDGRMGSTTIGKKYQTEEVVQSPCCSLPEVVHYTEKNENSFIAANLSPINSSRCYVHQLLKIKALKDPAKNAFDRKIIVLVFSWSLPELANDQNVCLTQTLINLQLTSAMSLN